MFRSNNDVCLYRSLDIKAIDRIPFYTSPANDILIVYNICVSKIFSVTQELRCFANWLKLNLNVVSSKRQGSDKIMAEIGALYSIVDAPGDYSIGTFELKYNSTVSR